MAILLEVGEVVAAPPDGKRLLKLDSDGAVTVVSPTGSESPVDTPGVESLEGDGVDNTDPLNPVIDLSDAIETAFIQDDAVTTDKIDDDAVTAAKIDETIDLVVGSVEVGAGAAATPSVKVGAAGVGLFGGLGRLRLSAASTEMLVLRENGTSVQLPLGSLYLNASETVGVEYASGHIRTFSAGDTIVGANGALATDAASGFLQVPTCAGTPTGTPVPLSGKACLVVDSTNNKLYGYYGGAWHDLTG